MFAGRVGRPKEACGVWNGGRDAGWGPAALNSTMSDQYTMSDLEFKVSKETENTL